MTEAISEGIDYTQRAIVTAEAKGQGHGPLNHGCNVVRRALSLYVAFLIAWGCLLTRSRIGASPSRPFSSDPHPFVSHLIRSTSEEWQAYVKHPFVLQLGRGTLDPDAFRHYIIQDWHYLRNCA